MFCPSCGSNLEDDAKFCANCGMSLSETAQVEATASKKQVDMKKIITPVIVVALVVIVAFGAVKLIGSLFSGSSNAVVYVKKDKLYYKENMKSKKEASEVARLHSDCESVPVTFSEDGKYLYFFSDVDDYSSGTLNRIEVKKIKASSDKNEKNIVEIASDVALYGYQFVGTKGVIYRCDNKKLEYFDGKEEYTIAKNCSEFVYNEDKNILIYSVLSDESEYTYSIYAGKFGKDMDAEKIDTNISNIVSMTNPEFIVYTKYNEESNELYVAGVEEEPEKISKNYSRMGAVNAEQKKLIFIESEESAQALYQFVEDDYAEADAGVEQPDAKEYMSEVALTEVLDADTYAYFLEYPEELSYFYEELWEDETIGMKGYSNWDTDKRYYYDGIKWYALDEVLYQSAMEEYNKNGDRITLRNSLKEEQYTEYVENAYYYEAGKEVEAVIEGVKNIVVSDADVKILSYQTANYNKPKLSTLESVWNLKEDIEENRTWITYCSIANGTPVELGAGSVYGTLMSADKAKCAMKIQIDGKYQIIMCSIKGNEITLEDTLTKNESNAIGVWKENEFYYLADIEDSYGVLYCYENGKSKEILDDVATGSIIMYDDDNCMVGECDTDGTYEFELYGANGKQIEKFTDVESIPTYINEKCILMIRRDKLCLYDGSDELKEIDRNVSNYSTLAETMGQNHLY